MKEYKMLKIKKTKDNEKLIELYKTFKDVKIFKNPITNTCLIFYIPPKPNPALSGKGVMLVSKYWSSGIYHK